MKITDLPKHHAVLLVDSKRDATGNALFQQLQSISPAHRFFNQTVLDIETARKIITWAQTPYNEEKIALVSFHTVGIEAQNALLKILEEPRPGVRFILLTSNKTNLIETVLSRVLEVRLNTEHLPNHNPETVESAEIFLATSHGLRMKLACIVNILSRVDEEDRKDRESVRSFILTLVILLRKDDSGSKYIEETLNVASYASDPSASGKALIEYLALLLPQTKV